jgi:hypothetical protein
MKSLTNILRRSNITPFERVKALVHNDIHREKTGKGHLSESDLYILTKGWMPSRSEAIEYNKYINIVQLEDTMKMDAQMFLYRSEISLLRNQRVIDSLLSHARKFKEKVETEFLKDISHEESIKFVTAQTYLEYLKVLHIFTFNSLPKDIQSDLLLLDEGSTSDYNYLSEQVFLYERFKNGDTLTKQDKDLIIDRIYSRMYYEGAKKIKRSTAEKDGFLLHVFFAELPIKEIFIKLADDLHIAYMDKDEKFEESLLSAIELYAKSKNTSIESLIKEKIFLWLDDGLFTKEYSPIFMSERFDTWNGNTKNNHKKLFIAWYTELQKSKEYFQKLFDTDLLTVQTIEKDFLGMQRQVQIITGISLYNCKENIDLVKEYKQQVELLMPISNMFLFVKKHAMPIKNYRTLCEFKELAQKVSSTFDIDMTEHYTSFINSYQDEVLLLNNSLSMLLDTAMEHFYTEKSFLYILEIAEGCFMFNLNDSEDAEEIAKKYSEKFEKIR